MKHRMLGVALAALHLAACGGEPQGELRPGAPATAITPAAPSASDPGEDAGAAPTSPTSPPVTDASAPPAPTPVIAADGGDETLASARALCVQTINDYRATLGLAPYAAWDAVDSCVDGEAQADSISGTPHSAFGTCAEHAQNECPDWPMAPASLIPKCLQDMWNEGPGTDFEAHGHYINMSSTKYTKASCGFFQTAGGHWWATQDFR
jgi:hypothetical protein